LFIPELIPDEDKIIYLDCDMIVRSSLAELYAMNHGDNYVLGVCDAYSRQERKRMGVPRYINAGMMLMNCKKMRDDAVYEKIADFIINHYDQIVMHDQDVVAAVFKGHIKYISRKWNGLVLRLPAPKKYQQINHANILHYVGKAKPWVPYSKSLMTEYYFENLKLTPFAGFEKKYRWHRALWHMMRLPANICHLIYKKQTSRFRTFKTYNLLGITIHKRKSDPDRKN
ncbi:hypothetical protein LJC19_07705, partial [Oxalobacter sp. OttesenSCG-928-P03]|nr:hypothetical protein [Oxalobacter sp. OttesenSCG-928-P03]